MDTHANKPIISDTEDQPLLTIEDVEGLDLIVHTWGNLPFWKRWLVKIQAVMGRKKALRAIAATMMAIVMLTVAVTLSGAGSPAFYILVGVSLGVLGLLALFLA
jgi:fatty acid desaturase